MNEYSLAKVQLYNLYASVLFFALHEPKKAIEAINKSIELFPYNSNAIALRGVFRTEIQNPIERYTKLQDIIQYKEADRDSLFLSKSEFNTELQEAAIKFADDFLQIPKEKRKYLVIDDEFRYLPNSFLVVTHNEIASLESKGLTFPNGFPHEKVLYLCHPYKSNEYLDAENYKDELFYDQVGELIEILQCLGAKQIDVKDLQTSETTEIKSSNYNAQLGGSVKDFKGDVKGDYSKNIDSYEKSKQEFFHHHEFPLSVPPYVPSGTVWYNHMSDWQRKARMRLRGEDKFKIQISSLKESLIKENEMIQLKADFEILLAKGNIEGGRSLSLEQHNANIHEWEIEVEFYPLNAYGALPTKELDKKEIDIKSTEQDKRKHYNKWFIWGLLSIIIVLIAIITAFIIQQ